MKKKFNFDGPDGSKKYCRGLRSPPRDTVRRQNGGGSVIVWAAFSAKGKTKIAVLAGKQASEHYVYTLSKFLIPFAIALRYRLHLRAGQRIDLYVGVDRGIY